MPKRRKSTTLPTVEPIPHDRLHLTPEEADRIIDTASRIGRHGDRDALMLMMLYHHGFRASQLCELQRRDVNLKDASMFLRAKKQGKNATHPLEAKEVVGLKKLLASHHNAFVFISERDTPFSVDALQRIVKRAGQAAGYGDRIHPHMFRHGCGFRLINNGNSERIGMAWLGHRTPAMFRRYSEVSAETLREIRW